ncbi:hypothetical protein SUGI_1020770, partial [Cryptomeria japonica]
EWLFGRLRAAELGLHGHSSRVVIGSGAAGEGVAGVGGLAGVEVLGGEQKQWGGFRGCGVRQRLRGGGALATWGWC